jgi:hypothetical protein
VQFHERAFTVYAFFIGASAVRPWSASVWDKLTKASESVFAFGRNSSAVRTLQYVGTPPNIKEVKFGRIPHHAKGATKWTHDPNGRIASGEVAQFVSAEVWAPAWTTCERERLAPEVYLSIFTRHGLVQNTLIGPPEFASACILAVAEDLGSAARINGRTAATAFAEILSSSQSLFCKRPWGRPSGTGFTDAINDLELTEPFRPPIRGHDNPVAHLSQMGWHPVSELLS